MYPYSMDTSRTIQKYTQFVKFILLDVYYIHMNNNLFNLMNQLTQELKSLWRIEQEYIRDAETDEQRSFWETLADDKKKHSEDLQNLIKAELNK